MVGRWLHILVVICTIVSFRYSNAQLSLDDLISNVFTTTRDNNVASTTPVSTPNQQAVKNKTTITTNRSEGFDGNPIDVGPNFTPTGMYKSCGFEKECVPRHLCVDGSISTTGENFIDIRIDNDVCSYNELCCNLPNKVWSNIQKDFIFKRKWFLFTLQRDKSVIPALPPEPHLGCGWRNVDGVGYKITGKVDESEFGEFPWMTAILRVEENGEEDILLYECGGSVIAPNVILTAAHCVSRRTPHELKVRMGEWDTQTTNEILPHVDKNVKEIILHEQYNKGTLYNDVALLVLDEPVEWAENIRPICLPESQMNFDRARCVATGWGKDKFGRDGKYQVILKKVDLPVVPHSLCEQYLRQTRLGYYYDLHPSALCAGGEAGHDVCKGDGGSPLICPIVGSKDRYYQTGIVAWGVGCAQEKVPGVYANVPYLRPWITEKLHLLGVDSSHFTP